MNTTIQKGGKGMIKWLKELPIDTKLKFLYALQAISIGVFVFFLTYALI